MKSHDPEPSLAQKRRKQKETSDEPTASMKKKIIEEYKTQFGLNQSFEDRYQNVKSPESSSKKKQKMASHVGVLSSRTANRDSPIKKYQNEASKPTSRLKLNDPLSQRGGHPVASPKEANPNMPQVKQNLNASGMRNKSSDDYGGGNKTKTKFKSRRNNFMESQEEPDFFEKTRQIEVDQSMRNLRDAQQNESGLRVGESGLDQNMSFKAINPKSKEKEENFMGSLTERAKRVVGDPGYLKRIHDIKQGKSSARVMDFVMDGVKIAMPYQGQKITAGYLKKETKSLGLLLKRNWQPKYCVIDLTKFLFKYARNPTEVFRIITLKEIIDVFIEEDPAQQRKEKGGGLFSSLTKKNQDLEGFNFQIITNDRVFRMQASTKVEQNMWVRAFAVIFELRIRLVYGACGNTIETTLHASSKKKSTIASNFEKKSLSHQHRQKDKQKAIAPQETSRSKKSGFTAKRAPSSDSSSSRHSVYDVDPNAKRTIEEVQERMEHLREELISIHSGDSKPKPEAAPFGMMQNRLKSKNLTLKFEDKQFDPFHRPQLSTQNKLKQNIDFPNVKGSLLSPQGAVGHHKKLSTNPLQRGKQVGELDFYQNPLNNPVEIEAFEDDDHARRGTNSDYQEQPDPINPDMQAQVFHKTISPKKRQQQQRAVQSHRSGVSERTQQILIRKEELKHQQELLELNKQIIEQQKLLQLKMNQMSLQQNRAPVIKNQSANQKPPPVKKPEPMSLSVETDLKKLHGGREEEKKAMDDEEYYYEYDDEADHQQEDGGPLQEQAQTNKANFLIQENNQFQAQPEALSPNQSEDKTSPIHQEQQAPADEPPSLLSRQASKPEPPLFSNDFNDRDDFFFDEADVVIRQSSREEHEERLDIGDELNKCLQEISIIQEDPKDCTSKDITDKDLPSFCNQIPSPGLPAEEIQSSSQPYNFQNISDQFNELISPEGQDLVIPFSKSQSKDGIEQGKTFQHHLTSKMQPASSMFKNTDTQRTFGSSFPETRQNRHFVPASNATDSRAVSDHTKAFLDKIKQAREKSLGKTGGAPSIGLSEDEPFKVKIKISKKKKDALGSRNLNSIRTTLPKKVGPMQVNEDGDLVRMFSEPTDRAGEDQLNRNYLRDSLPTSKIEDLLSTGRSLSNTKKIKLRTLRLSTKSKNMLNGQSIKAAEEPTLDSGRPSLPDRFMRSNFPPEPIAEPVFGIENPIGIPEIPRQRQIPLQQTQKGVNQVGMDPKFQSFKKAMLKKDQVPSTNLQKINLRKLNIRLANNPKTAKPQELRNSILSRKEEAKTNPTELPIDSARIKISPSKLRIQMKKQHLAMTSEHPLQDYQSSKHLKPPEEEITLVQKFEDDDVVHFNY